jgi:uncharacterized membrane protein (DUF4010 family)
MQSKRIKTILTNVFQSPPLRRALFVWIVLATLVTLLPSKVIDPWGVLNPRLFGVIVVTLAALELGSYLALEFFGRKNAGLLVGFLGGLVSSTAVFFSVTQSSRAEPSRWKFPLRTIVAAQIAALLEVLLIIFMASSWSLLVPVSLALLPSLLLCVIAIAATTDASAPSPITSIKLKSPLNWWGVIRLALLFFSILVIVSAAKKFGGQEGGALATFLTGLFELHGLTLAQSTVYAQGTQSLTWAWQLILLACGSSLVSKIILSLAVARGKTRAYLSMFFTLILLVLLGTGLMMRFLSVLSLEGF